MQGPLELLSREKVLSLHEASLKILKEIGVKVENESCLQVLGEAGADVDIHTRVVRIPARLVEDSIENAPDVIRLYGRDDEKNVSIGGKNVYSMSNTGATHVLDLDGKYRAATLRDLEDLTRLQDALKNINVLHSLVDPSDIAAQGMYVTIAFALMKNTVKPFCLQVGNGEDVKTLFEIATVICGSEDAAKKKPIFTVHDISAISPLVQTDENGQVIMEAAKHGIPGGLTIWPMPGLTGPVTLAGSIAQKIANFLCGLTISQLVNSGTPFLLPVEIGAFDMKTGNAVTASPEIALMGIAGSQLARFYNIPSIAVAATDSKLSDEQAGYEKMLMILLFALSGINLIHGCTGGMDGMDLTSYEQCIIDNDIVGSVFRVLSGFEVTEQTLALHVIGEIFSSGSTYLDHQHTVKHFREVSWEPEISVRQKRALWEQDGAKDIRERAKEKVRKILKEHIPAPLPKEVEKEIIKIIEKAQGQSR
jgi:trimethylamine--corrinoid protein Co-methyltransferase